MGFFSLVKRDGLFFSPCQSQGKGLFVDKRHLGLASMQARLLAGAAQAEGLEDAAACGMGGGRNMV